ncbi:hypothetical protein J2Z81_002406 [Virgibacillus campisalis]|uniref:Uncharacterized protein n=1 Tax=Virgibacillus alimentarius TaxID=698769 RepID=A0ABS4SAA2_9BACI|nr:hypothetical protein [Virgibacillus alimentarius]
MVLVCTKHVKEGLKFIHLPHIYPLSSEDKTSENVNCLICGHQAEYKLFNFFFKGSKRKKMLSN